MLVLESLPNELLLIIANNLHRNSLNSLLRTNRFFSNLLTPMLHKFATQNRDNLPPLCWAALHGHEPLARLLLEKGLDPDCWKRPRKGPLHYATLKQNEGIVRLLLSKGAKIDAKYSNSLTALGDAVKANNESMVRLLLEHGANVNPRSKKNRPLHLAAQLGHLPIAKLLVESGAIVDAKGVSGTALLRATFYKNEAIVDFLASNGAWIDAQDVYYHQTSLSMAAEAANVEMVRTLLRHQADCNVLDSRGRTALHHTLSNWAKVQENQERLDIATLLLEHGADVNVQDNQGTTPLHIAALRPSCEILQMTVALLLDYGADVDAQDDKGETALHIAIGRHKDELIDLLMKRNANLSIKDNLGKTAWDLTVSAKLVAKLGKNHMAD